MTLTVKMIASGNWAVKGSDFSIQSTVLTSKYYIYREVGHYHLYLSSDMRVRRTPEGKHKDAWLKVTTFDTLTEALDVLEMFEMNGGKLGTMARWTPEEE